MRSTFSSPSSLLCLYLPPPHQLSHRQFLPARLVSSLLGFPDITSPPSSLFPLHDVIMIIAHRGLRKLNFPFRSGSFIPPVTLCAAPPLIPSFSQALEFGPLIESRFNVYLCVFVFWTISLTNRKPFTTLPTLFPAAFYSDANHVVKENLHSVKMK